MFFIGIFGIEGKEKEIRFIENIYCKNCNDTKQGRLIKRYNFFHFFFIPLFKWGIRYFVICNTCNAVYEISKEKGESLEKGEISEITYWDLKETISEGTPKERYCSNCGRVIEGEFRFCPYCGVEIE